MKPRRHAYREYLRFQGFQKSGKCLEERKESPGTMSKARDFRVSAEAPLLSPPANPRSSLPFHASLAFDFSFHLIKKHSSPRSVATKERTAQYVQRAVCRPDVARQFDLLPRLAPFALIRFARPRVAIARNRRDGELIGVNPGDKTF